jgi:hypothetical protein
MPASVDRRPRRLTRFQKIAAATGAATVGTAALSLSGALPEQAGGGVRAGTSLPARETAWKVTSAGPAEQQAAVGAQALRAEKAAQARRAAAAKEEARREAAARAAAERRPDRSSARAGITAASGSPREIARSLVGDSGQFACFSRIVERESGWDVTARNPSSGAYGLLQALPGSKMASAGADWRTNPATQIEWGVAYMKDRYGSPCGAWSFWQGNGWY